MVQPLVALLGLLLLVSTGSPAAPPTQPSAAAVSGSAAALASPAAAPDGHVASPAPASDDGTMIQRAPVSSPPALDLRRPRIFADDGPEVAPAFGTRRRDAADERSLNDQHLIRLTKDRGS